MIENSVFTKWRIGRASSLAMAAWLCWSGCLQFRSDDKPFLCEERNCTGGGTVGGGTVGGGTVGGGTVGGGTVGGGLVGGGLVGGGIVGGGIVGGGIVGGGTWDGGSSWRFLPGPQNSDFGTATAISADGRWLFVGAPGSLVGGGTATGRVFAYDLLRASDAPAFTVDAPADARRFGTSLACTPDGQQLIVGAPSDLTRSDGLAYWFKFELTDGGRSSIRMGPTLPTRGGLFGASVAISAAGHLMAVGAPGQSLEDGGPALGAVEVYRRDGGVAVHRETVTDSRLDALDGFGSSIALSDDGTIMVIGAPGDDSDTPFANNSMSPDSGAAWVFVAAGTWTRQRVLKQNTLVPGGGFGRTVAMTGIGTTVAVGGVSNNVASFEMWTRSFNAWYPEVVALTFFSTGPAPEPSVALSRSRDTVVAAQGSRAFSSEIGMSQSEIIPPDAGQRVFGSSLALSADASVVAFGADPYVLVWTRR